MQESNLVFANNGTGPQSHIWNGEFTRLNPLPSNLKRRPRPSLHKITEIANFTIECLSQKKLPGGGIERRFRMVNSNGETSGDTPLVLDRYVFSKSLPFFRGWVLGRGNFVWSGSLSDLHQLRDHLFNEATWREVPYV